MILPFQSRPCSLLKPATDSPSASYTHQIKASLYKAIYSYVLSQPRIAELTVEDPAEAFEDLRDRCDMRMLLAHKIFISEGLGIELGASGKGKGKSKGKLGPPAEKGWVEKWKRDLKIAGVSGLCFMYAFQQENLRIILFSVNSPG